LAAHVLQRVVRGKSHTSRHTIDVATAQEISTICRSLAWLDYLVDEERFALDSLIELYAGERSGDVLGRVRGRATLAIVLMTLRPFPRAPARLAEADTIAQRSADPVAIATAALGRGWLAFVTGSLDEGLAACQPSAATFHSIGDIRGWGATCFFICW